MSASIQQVMAEHIPANTPEHLDFQHLRTSLLRSQNDSLFPTWQSSLDALRLQQLPYDRQMMQLCRAVHRQEHEELRKEKEADAPGGLNTPGRSAAPGSERHKKQMDGANEILRKMAVNTGLSFFFFMLDRDTEAKGFVLESSSSLLAGLHPLALHDRLGPLERESLAKAQDFLIKAAGAPSAPISANSSTADDALSSLISLALARGSLDTNLALARLLFSCPQILKTRHLLQIRSITAVSQTWSFDTSPSNSSEARVFRPQAGSTEELIHAWEQHVLPQLKACLPDDNTSIEKWANVVSALEAGRDEEARQSVCDVLSSAGDLAAGTHGIHFPSAESLAAQRRSAECELEGDGDLSPDRFLDAMEQLLSSGGTCTSSQACAVLLSALHVLALRLELPRVVPLHLVEQPPAHCIADDCSATFALYSFFQNVCAVSPSNSTRGAAPTDRHYTEQAATGVREEARTCADTSLETCAQRRIAYAWLVLLRVNLEWESRCSLSAGRSKIPSTCTTSRASAAAGGADAPETGRTAALEQLETQLRECILLEQSAPHRDLAESAPPTAPLAASLRTITARTLALECYSAGIPLFFQRPAHLVAALRPLLLSVGNGTATSFSKQICARLLWNFGDYQMIWSSLMDAANAEKGQDGEVRGGVHDVGLGAQQGQEWEGIVELLECVLGTLFRELQGYLVSGVPASKGKVGQDGSDGITRVEVPVTWAWGRYTRTAMWVDESGRMLQKTSANPDYSVALSAVSFTTGIHCWVIRVDVCQRLLVGVCHGTVDLHRRVNGGWGWHSHGTMSGPGQPDKEIGEFSNNDTLCLKLDMHRGVLEFFKNGDFKGSVKNVTGEVFPFVCMDYDGERVTLLRQYDVVEREAGVGAHLDFTAVCSRTLHNFTALINALLDEDNKARWLQQLASAVLIRIVDQLSSFLECLDSHAAAHSAREEDQRACNPQKAKDDIAAADRCRGGAHRHTLDGKCGGEEFAGSGSKEAETNGDSCRPTGRHDALLEMLDFMARGSTARHEFNWLPNILLFVARLEPLPSECTGLLESMVTCVMVQRAFLRRHRPLLMYHGRYFRSFLLRGKVFSKPNFYCSIQHEGPWLGSWTIDVMVKRGPTADACALSVVLAAHEFALSLDEPRGDVKAIRLIDHTAGHSGAASQNKIWNFDAACSQDTWMLITLVSTEGCTNLFIDGTKVGSVPKQFALGLTAVGADPRNPKTEYLCGSVRELRVVTRALSDADIRRSVQNGLADPAMDPVFLFLEFTGRGERVVTECESLHVFCTDVGQNGEIREHAMGGDTQNGGGGCGEEEHWLYAMAQVLNGLTASMAASLMRGQEHSDEDAACQVWLNSPLFAPGYRCHNASVPVLSGHERAYLDNALDHGRVGGASTETLTHREHTRILDHLLLPLLAVRQSQDLDALERMVVATILYHCGELGRVLSFPAGRPPDLEAVCQAVSLAARGVRRHVTEMRDLANLALKESEDPREWKDFCLPVVDRCRLLLRLGPMHPRPSEVTGEHDTACRGEVPPLPVGADVVVQSAGKIGSRSDMLACSVHNSSTVFTSMHSHVYGSTSVKRVATLVTEFVKEHVETRSMMNGLERRQSRAVEVQVGLSALVRLLAESGMGQQKNDVLSLLQDVANPSQHYLSAISSSGHHAEEQVRSCFRDLVNHLVDILQAGYLSKRPDVVVAAASALTVALDGRDLSHILSTQLLEVLNAFWASGASTPAPSSSSRHDEIHAGEALVPEADSVRTLNRLLISLLLALGAHAPQLDELQPPQVLDCAHRAVAALFAQATLQVGGTGGSWKYWHGQWKRAHGKAKPHKLFLMLHESDDSMSSQRVLHGSARYRGCTYQVHGSSRVRPALPQSVTLYCTRVACAPGSPSDVQPFETDDACDALTLVGSITDDLRLMKGYLFKRHHAIPAVDASGCEGVGGHDGVFEVYSMSSVPVPLSYFSRHTRRVISLSAGGFIQFVGEDEECGVVQASQPVTSADNYIQVHVMESQRESAVAIGVAGRNYALDQMPGWQEGSIAYHLDDGNLFVQAGDPARFGPVCLQGDIVGCRVKFFPDGVTPESITWTRNGEFIGTKSIHRIPGLSHGGPLFFSIGLNRPGEKILVSTGTSPDLPSDTGVSTANRNSSTVRFDTAELTEADALARLVMVNNSASIESTGKVPVFSLVAASQDQINSNTRHKIQPSKQGGQAMYTKTLDFSRQSSFRTRFCVATATHHGCSRQGGGVAFVLQYDSLAHGDASDGEQRGVSLDGNHGALWSQTEEGQVCILLTGTGADMLQDSKKKPETRTPETKGPRGSDVATGQTHVPDPDAHGHEAGTTVAGAHRQVQIFAGGKLLSTSRPFGEPGEALQIWVEYASENQLLSVFIADTSASALQSHTHQRPEEAPLLTAHINLASYVGDRARVGFCCHGARAGESASIDRGSTDDVESESCCEDAASGRHPGTPTDSVAGDHQRYVIRSWRFELTRRLPMSTAQADAKRVRGVANKELTVILSGLHAVGQDNRIKSELQQPHWQSLMWKLVFSNSLEIQARTHALQAVALSLKQPDAQGAATSTNCRESVDKLLWLVANLSPEGNFCQMPEDDKHRRCSNSSSAVFSSVRSCSGGNDNTVVSHVRYLPSVVTWQSLATGQRARIRHRAGQQEKPERRQEHMPTGMPLAPCLAFRSKVISLIKHLSSLPHRRACVTAAMLEAIRRIGRACGTAGSASRDATSVAFGTQSLHRFDLASVLVLGGVVDVLGSRGEQVCTGEAMPFDMLVLEAFLETASVLLARVPVMPDDLASKPVSLESSGASTEVSQMYQTELAVRVVRTRIVKALLDLLALPPVRSLVSSKYPRLIQTLVGISEMAITGVPLTYLSSVAPTGADSSTDTLSKPSFDVASVLSSRVYITNCGSTCDIRSGSDCSVMVGAPLYKCSGRHYVEFKILFSRGDYSFIGCAVESFRTSNVIGDHKGSWAWANDGDFKSGGDWCGDRGLAPFRSGDHVGLLVDMDTSTLRFTKNGKLLRKTCSLSSATATGEGVRFAVGSNSHLKIEIADAYKYRHVREAGSHANASPWLTVEMIISKSYLLSLEGAGGDRGADVPAAQHGRATGDDSCVCAPPAADAAGASPAGAAGAAEVRASQAARRRRFCHVAARFLDETGYFGKFCHGQDDLVPSASGVQGKSLTWLGEALWHKSVSDEVLIPEVVAAAQSKVVSGESQVWTSPWQTSGSKRLLLLQCESALMLHFARLCVLDLLRARHVPTAMTVDAPRLISLLSPFFPRGYQAPRAVCSTGAYANIVPILDEVLAGWIFARGDGSPESLVHELRTLANATSEALQHMCLHRRLSSLGVQFLLDVPVASNWQELQRTRTTPTHALRERERATLPSVVTWVVPSRLPLSESTSTPPCDEAAMEQIASFNLAAWLATHLAQRYALQGHPGCAPALTELQEQLVEAISVTNSQPLCLSLLQALLVAVSHPSTDEEAKEDGALMRGAGSEKMVRGVCPLCFNLLGAPTTNIEIRASGWSIWTLQVLKQLRTAAVQLLLLQQNPDVAKQRVLHTPLLQALISTVVAVDLRVHSCVHKVVTAHLAAAASLAQPAPSPLLPTAPGIAADQRSERTQKVVQQLLEMGFPQKHIDSALWATANEDLEHLSSERGTQVLNYLSTCAPLCPPNDGNFPLAPHPFGVPSVTDEMPCAATQPARAAMNSGESFPAPWVPGNFLPGESSSPGINGGSMAEVEHATAAAGNPDCICAGEGKEWVSKSVQGLEEEPALDSLWANIDASTCKALRAMESITLLSHALRCLEDAEPVPLWLQDVAKAAAADRQQFLSWDDGDEQSGMVVGKSCLACRRSPLLPDGRWASVTGNLPFDVSGDATSANNYFSIRLSRMARAKDAAGCTRVLPSLASLRICFGVVRTSELSDHGAGGSKVETARAILHARGYSAGSVVLCCNSDVPFVRSFWPSTAAPGSVPQSRRGAEADQGSLSGVGRMAGNACGLSDSDAALHLLQKSVVMCDERPLNMALVPPPLSEQHIGNLFAELNIDAAQLRACRVPAAGCSASAVDTAHGSQGSCPLESVLLTVQVKADGKINFFEGQGPAATLLAQSEMAYGSSCPGALVPFVSLLDSDVLCEVINQGCSAPPTLDSGSADKGSKSLLARATSVLAGPHGFPGRNARSRVELDWDMAMDPSCWSASMDSLLVQYASERALVKGKKLAQLLPGDLFDDVSKPTANEVLSRTSAAAPVRKHTHQGALEVNVLDESTTRKSDSEAREQATAGNMMEGERPQHLSVEQHKDDAALSDVLEEQRTDDGAGYPWESGVGIGLGFEGARRGSARNRKSVSHETLADSDGDRGAQGASPASFDVSPILMQQPSTTLSPAVRSTSITSPNIAAAISVSPLKPKGMGGGWGGGAARHLGDLEIRNGNGASIVTGDAAEESPVASRDATKSRWGSTPMEAGCAGIEARATMITLSQLPPRALKARFAILKCLNEMVRIALPLVDLRLYEDSHNIAHMLARNKGRLFLHIKEAALLKSLDLSRDSSDVPHVTLNRGTTPANRRKWEKTLFYQVFRGLEERPHSLRAVDRRGNGKQSWVTTFEGEGGSDHGGLFRDSLREICAELQSQGGQGGLQLLVPCPNQRLGRGANQDKWLPRPRSAAATCALGKTEEVTAAVRGKGGGTAGDPKEVGQTMKMLKFLGALMGASLRTDSALELDLPSLVWKPLVGELCDFSDLVAVDESLAADLVAIRECPSPQEWARLARGLTWRVLSVSGQWIELMPNGAKRRVLWRERLLYVEEAVRARLGEFDAEIDAIKAGFFSVVPSLVLPLLTWRDLEAKVCGTPIIDVEVLKKMTDHSLPRKDKHPVAVMFWQVVTDMSNCDRAALLAFASGRRRLPAPNSGGHFKIELLHGRGDEALPEAHTCFFTIDLPQYSSTQVMREKILYAIHNCSAIDKDFTARGGALYDPEDDTAQCTEGPGTGELYGVGGLRVDGIRSQPITPGSADEEESGASAGGEGGVGDEWEPLTAEFLSNSWNVWVSRPYAATLNAACPQMCIPRDGGHDDCAEATHVRAYPDTPAESTHSFASKNTIGRLSREEASGGDTSCIQQGSINDSSQSLHPGPNVMWEPGSDGIGNRGYGLLSGGAGWDPGMLDRMQAADVYSGMSGIDHVSDSGDGSAGDEESEDVDHDEEDDEDDDNSDPEIDDWDDVSGTDDSDISDDMSGGSHDSNDEDEDDDDTTMREHDDMASDDMYDDDEGERTDDEASHHDSVGEDHPVDHEW